MHKIHHSFTKKALKILGVEVNYLNIIKCNIQKPRVRILLDGERLKELPARKECLPLPLLFNAVPEVIASVIGREK